MKDKNQKVPDLLVEKLALGELPEEQAKEIISRLKENGEFGRLEAVKMSNEEILKEYPAREMSDKIRHRLEQKSTTAIEKEAKTPFLKLMPVVASFAVAAIALFVVFYGNFGFLNEKETETTIASKETENDTIRIKGSKPYLLIHRKLDAGIELLSPEAFVRQNDVLQISYVAFNQSYGVIFSIDGNGAVTLHFPEEKSASSALDKKGETALPHSYELDNAPNFERFFFVTSTLPFDIEVVLSAADELAKDSNKAIVGTLELPEQFEQASIIFKKVLQ